jgi:hypothetical protein
MRPRIAEAVSCACAIIGNTNRAASGKSLQKNLFIRFPLLVSFCTIIVCFLGQAAAQSVGVGEKQQPCVTHVEDGKYCRSLITR